MPDAGDVADSGGRYQIPTENKTRYSAREGMADKAQERKDIAEFHDRAKLSKPPKSPKSKKKEHLPLFDRSIK